MGLLLKPLSEEEYEIYFDKKVKRYANAIQKDILNGGTEALVKAKIQMDRYLPQGLKTLNHYIFKLIEEENNMGYLWINVNLDNQSAYLYDIFIQEQYRGKGLGKQAIKKAESWLSQFDIVHFDLHVFGSNNYARNLYEKLGFRITSIYMRKELNNLS